MQHTSTRTVEGSSLGVFRLDPVVSLANAAAGAAALAYIAGFLIYTIDRNRCGIANHTLLKAEFVEIGIIFFLFSLSLVVIPAAFGIVLRRIAQQHSIMTGGYSRQQLLPTLTLVTHLYYVTLFFALFVTEAEMHLSVRVFYWTTDLGFLFSLLVSVTTIALVSCMVTRVLYVASRKNSQARRHLPDQLFELGTNVVKALLLVFMLMFDSFLLRSVLWIPGTLYRMRFWLPIVLALSVVVLVLPFRYNTLAERFTRRLLVVAMLCVLVPGVYLDIMTYADGVFPSLPSDRGGRYPVTVATFQFKDIPTGQGRSLTKFAEGKERESQPLFIIEQTDTLVYVCRPYPLGLPEPSIVFAIPTSNVSEIIFENNKYRLLEDRK